ncbi:hypothetical protein SO078_23980 (plasmid) [Sinorhizobium meliloti]|uniref:hypothetical protein n=1 Tax=Rhizobium meliloti TaxID=382 RepID=UPI002D783EFC|nr:hypothetical protein [Sinorhizobium meliloti]WRQ69944.1 hypothetical protein SO078_23980 [Sinorhizobium meliloti]
MIKTLPLLCMAVALSGCASMAYPLSKCDGYSRRPLNRSMWQWEDNGILKQKQSDARPVASRSVATAYAEASKGPPAFAHLGVGASYRPCQG